MQPGVRFLPSPGAAKEPNYDVNATVDFWIPAAPDPQYLKDPYWNLVARLRDGTTERQGQQELALFAAREAQSEKDFAGFTPQLASVTEEMKQNPPAILIHFLGHGCELGRKPSKVLLRLCLSRGKEGQFLLSLPFGRSIP